MKMKIVVSSAVLFLLIATSIQSVAQASSSINIETSDVFHKENPERLLAEPTGTFEIPSDIKASMTKDELYELQALPGYFTPQQTSISNNQQLREQDPQPVKAIVCVDEDMKYYMAVLFEVPPEIITWEDVYNWAENILEGGDDYLEIPFAIDIQAEIFVNWNTPANYDYSDMLSALGTVDPTGVGCDILLLMTAQQDPNYEGLAYSLGRHFVMDCSVGLPANLFQHEASHLFGAPDHGWDFFTYCIISFFLT